MQVVLSAIGDPGVNTGHFGFCLGAVSGAEFLFTQATLGAGKPGGIFGRVAWIADLVALAGDKQVFQTEIDTHHVRGDRQHLGFKVTQAGDEVSTCVVFGDGNGTGFARERSAPADSQWGFAFSNVELAAFVGKGATSQLDGLSMVLLLESGVFGPPLEEVFKGRLLMPKALLERDTGHVIEPVKFAGAFDAGQFGIGLNVADFFLALIEGIGAPTKDVIVDKARTAERLGKQLGLFRCWVKAVFVGAFCHVSHFISFNVKIAIV